MSLQNVERVDIIRIGGIEITAVIDAGGGDVIKNDVAKIAVGVDNGYTPAFSDVVNSHVGDESGLAGAGFTNNIAMAATVFTLFDAKNGVFIVKFSFGKKGNIALLFIV